MGRLASRESQSKQNSAGHCHLKTSPLACLCGLLLLAFLVCSLCFALPVAAQSGRRKETQKKDKATPGPIAEPNRPSGSSSTTSAGKKDVSSKKSTDEIDPSDIV